MSTRHVTKSKKQYVQAINSPARIYAANLKDAKGVPFPGYIEPLFATKVPSAPSTDSGVKKINLDGSRPQAPRHQPPTRCYPRREHDWSHKFPTIIEAVSKLPGEYFVLDGEAVI